MKSHYCKIERQVQEFAVRWAARAPWSLVVALAAVFALIQWAEVWSGVHYEPDGVRVKRSLRLLPPQEWALGTLIACGPGHSTWVNTYGSIDFEVSHLRPIPPH